MVYCMQRHSHPVWRLPICQPIASSQFGYGLRAGFSLLELLVVVAIMVLLASLIAPNVIKQVQENHVARAAESVRDAVSQSRTLALDAGIDYQFRYEINGRQFVVLPMELEPTNANAGGDAEVARYVRVAGELDEGIRLQASDTSASTESLEAAWFGDLSNGLLLSQASWSAPVVFRFDGSADDAAFYVTSDDKLTADLKVRGLTGSVSVSRVYRKAD